MDLFDKEMKKESSALGFKSLRKPLKISEHQTGKSNKKRDKSRKALPPGKRRSKTGKIYWESRANRSDLTGSDL